MAARLKKPKRKLTRKEIKAAADRAEARSAGREVEAEHGPLNPPEMGRPTKFRPEFIAKARELCEEGATDQDLADYFEVNTSTIWRWRCSNKDFCRAMDVGKELPDTRVKRSLYQRAVGYSFETEKLFAFQGSITRAKVVEHIPPDPVAALKWLSNRQPKEWRETTRNEISGPDGGPIEITDQTKLALARWIAYTLSEAAGGPPQIEG